MPTAAPSKPSIDHLEPAGEGALQAAYEELKQRLGREGLFAQSQKLPLPNYPRHIVVISSEKGRCLARCPGRDGPPVPVP